MKLWPDARVVVERRKPQDDMGLVLARRDDVTPAHRAKESLLSGRGLVGGDSIFAGNPAKVLASDAGRCRVCGRMRLSTTDAVAMADGSVDASDFVYDGSAVAAASHAATFRRGLTTWLSRGHEAKFREELDGGIDVLHHDADAIHSLDRHGVCFASHVS